MRTLVVVPLVALFTLGCSGDDPVPAGTGGTAGSAGATGGAGMPGGAGMATSGSGGMPGSAGMSATGGMPGAAGMATNNGDYPPDLSMEGLIAMIEAEDYRGPTWKSDGTAVNTMPDPISPHGNMWVWYNQAIRQSNAAGDGGIGMPFASGSMVVKEMYTGTAVIGHAVMFRAGTAWYYYCLASEDRRCSSSSLAGTAEAVTTGGVGSCGCHGGGTVITQPNIPAP